MKNAFYCGFTRAASAVTVIRTIAVAHAVLDIVVETLVDDYFDILMTHTLRVALARLSQVGNQI